MKNRLMALALGLVICLGLAVPVWAAQTNSENMANENYEDAINNYMEQMNAIYVSGGTASTASIQDMLIDPDGSWQARISSWAEELEIAIISQESKYSVKSVMAQDDFQTKLLVYIWTTLEYENIGEHQESYIMGFGMDHILTLDTSNDPAVVTEDSFINEMLDYSHGDPDDCAMLLAECGDTDAESLPLDIDAEFQSAVAYANYDAAAAVDYSDEWVGHKIVNHFQSMNPAKYNPEYYYYANADCANFVSQCLLEGGMKPQGDWTVTKNTGSTVPVADTSCTKSGTAWRDITYFKPYWKGQGYNEVPVTSASQALAGNPIFEDGHVMLIVGVDSQGRIIINGHNTDSYHCLLRKNSNYTTIDLVHDYSTYVCTANTHTLACRVCNARKGAAQAHSWISNGNNLVCAVCGYTKSGITVSETPEQQG